MAWLAVVLAVAVGLLLGLMGGGGSILMVPLLTYVAGLDPKEAIAGSLFVVGVIVQRAGVGWIHALMPPVVMGTIVALIGLNLAGATTAGAPGSPLTKRTNSPPRGGRGSGEAW